MFANPVRPMDASSPGDPDPAWDGSLCGWAVAGGDWNGDGTADVFAGAPQFAMAGGTTPCGTFPAGDPAGRIGGWNGTNARQIALYRPEPEGAKNHLGLAVGLGDVDGDGELDVVGCSPGHDVPSTPAVRETGRVYVFLNP